MKPLPTVLFVVVPAPLGGSNRSMITVLRSLEGKVTRVLAVPRFGDFRQLVETEGLAEEFVDLPRRPRSPFDRFLRMWGGAILAWWAVRNRKRLTAIHANALTGLNLSFPASFLSRRRTVVWIHDPVGSAWGARLGPVIRRLLPNLRIGAVSTTAEAVAVDNGLCAYGAAQLIPNPIDPDDVLAASRPANGEAVVIGVLGGTTRRKGFDLLPSVIGELSSSSVRWQLNVSSSVSSEMEPTWDALSQYPESLVDNAGKLVDVRRAYETLDIVFCPSRNESFCRVAAEAMLNGLPVVASDIEPLRQLLGEDEAGLLFPVSDVAAAVDALRRLVDDPALRQSMGATGKERARRFQPDAIAAQLLDLYDIPS